MAEDERWSDGKAPKLTLVTQEEAEYLEELRARAALNND